MHWFIEIGFIYIDLNIYKSLSNKARESTIAISNHRDEKRTGSVVEERRKGVKRQERAQAIASLQSLQITPQSCFPRCASSLTSSFCSRTDLYLSGQIWCPCWRFLRPPALQPPRCQTPALQAALLSHSQPIVLWCVLGCLRRIGVLRCCESELALVRHLKGMLELQDWVFVPSCHSDTFPGHCCTSGHKPREQRDFNCHCVPVM